MGLGFLVLFAVVGGVIGLIWGFDPYKVWGNIGTALFALASIPFIITITTSASDINASTNILNNYVQFWADNFVSVILGEVAGQFAGALLSPFNRR